MTDMTNHCYIVWIPAYPFTGSEKNTDDKQEQCRQDCTAQKWIPLQTCTCMMEIVTNAHRCNYLNTDLKKREEEKINRCDWAKKDRSEKLWLWFISTQHSVHTIPNKVFYQMGEVDGEGGGGQGGKGEGGGAREEVVRLCRVPLEQTGRQLYSLGGRGEGAREGVARLCRVPLEQTGRQLYSFLIHIALHLPERHGSVTNNHTRQPDNPFKIPHRTQHTWAVPHITI